MFNCILRRELLSVVDGVYQIKTNQKIFKMRHDLIISHIVQLFLKNSSRQDLKLLMIGNNCLCMRIIEDNILESKIYSMETCTNARYKRIAKDFAVGLIPCNIILDDIEYFVAIPSVYILNHKNRFINVMYLEGNPENKKYKSAN